MLASLPFLAAALLLVGGASVAISWSPPAPAPADAAPPLLPAVHAVPVRVDTLFLGGYARGSFRQALATLASDLAPAERGMIGRHLDKIFTGVLEQAGLGSTGRLRVACERVVRPDGSTRSIRVLAAEAAVGGTLHTAFFYEREGQPGFYDPLGRALDVSDTWTTPLPLPSPRVTSPFGLRRMHPILNRVLPHTGTDFAAPMGTPVHATADGSVSYAGTRGGYGEMVEVQHPNGYATRYAHLSHLAVEAGQPVRQGEVIGYSGMSGLATGPHLHYEVRVQDRPVDPERVALLVQAREEVGYDAAWSRERRALARLLARAPTTLHAARARSVGRGG